MPREGFGVSSPSQRYLGAHRRARATAPATLGTQPGPGEWSSARAGNRPGDTGTVRDGHRELQRRTGILLGLQEGKGSRELFPMVLRCDPSVENTFPEESNHPLPRVGLGDPLVPPEVTQARDRRAEVSSPLAAPPQRAAPGPGAAGPGPGVGSPGRGSAADAAGKRPAGVGSGTAPGSGLSGEEEEDTCEMSNPS